MEIINIDYVLVRTWGGSEYRRYSCENWHMQRTSDLAWVQVNAAVASELEARYQLGRDLADTLAEIGDQTWEKPMTELDKFIVPYKGGLCGVREYPNDIFIIEGIDGTPLVLDVMPQIAKSLYDMGFRGVTLVACAGEFKLVWFGLPHVAKAESWAKEGYKDFPPAWATLSLAQVESLIGGEL